MLNQSKRNIMVTTMEVIMDRIIDIHNHILPGVDDGSRTIDESIKLIKYLKSLGVKDIVLTSHYIKGTKYEFNTLVRNNILNQLKASLNDPEVNLYLGNEVYLGEEVIELYEKHELSTLNNSKYMLVELPLSTYSKNFPNILCELDNYGVVPIIAHPERYRFLQKNRNRISELLEFNSLLQINVDSLTGKYGNKAKKLAKWLLKNNLVQFVGTDIHHIEHSKRLKKAYNKLYKLVGEKKYNELTYYNPKSVLENKNIIGNLDYFRKDRSW